MKRIFSVFLILLLIFSVDHAFAQKSVLNTVVIDAGHGGKDPGALGTGKYNKTEKNIALDVSLKLGKYLEEGFPNMKILYTRTTDVFLTLKDRTDLANNANADLFISIHCDSFTKPSAKGSSSHVMGLRYTEANLRVAQKENSVMYLEDNYKENYDGFDPYSPESIIAFSLSQTTFLDQSILMAQKIQEQFRDRVNRVDRGVKQTPLWVTRATSMPSVLVELGFISNEGEEEFLNSDAGQTYMASAIYRAIKEYKRELELSDFLEENIVEKQLNKEVEKIDSTKLFKEQEESVQKDIIFRVQISTSLQPKKISDVENYKVFNYVEKDIYKYTIGDENTLEDAKELRKIAVKNGYTDAFIIAFLKNKKVSISTAIEYQNNKHIQK
ncbi:N-acetylmuramoyl-L-alanine amidase [Flavobacteriales bacterium]|nr:N-acetylmuramoyl-L-alanine amidase [Flavobacteriales bacterium]